MKGQSSVHDLAEKTLFFQLLLSFLLVFSSPLKSATSHQGTILKLNQLHTQTHTSQQLSLYVSSLGLMPAFLSQTLCVILSSSLSLWSCGLVGPGIQFSCHPDASPSAHTHTWTNTHTEMDFLSGQFETNQTVVLEHAHMRAKGRRGTPHTMRYSLSSETHSNTQMHRHTHTNAGMSKVRNIKI